MNIRIVISQVVFVACVLFGIGIEQVGPWVQGGSQPFLDGEAPVMLHRFCRLSSGASSRWCGRDSDQTWVDMIQRATSEWNNAGADFVFSTRAGRATDDPCRIRDAVVVLFASQDNLCPDDRHFSIRFEVGGFTVKEQGGNWARIYIFHGPALTDSAVYGLLLHELGHVVGLDHPDEYGQNVDAIMNSRVVYASLQQDDIDGIRGLHGTRQVLTGFLENPGPGSFHSGIGVISGWVCEAEEVEIEITTAFGEVLRFDAAYGTERADTAGKCGDTDNGFGLLFNWNRLGTGEHEVTAFVDGEELGHAMFSVTIPSQFDKEIASPLSTRDFLRGAAGECLVEDFPHTALSGRFRWNQSTQHLELVEVLPTLERPVLGHLTTHFDGTWQFTARTTPSDDCTQRPDSVFTCTIVNGVVQCSDGVLQGTVAEGGAISSISFYNTYQGQLQGNRGSGTLQSSAWVAEGGQVIKGCEGAWTAVKQ